jgi:hypothetical protein
VRLTTVNPQGRSRESKADEYTTGQQVTNYLWRGSHGTSPSFTEPPEPSSGAGDGAK